MINGYLVVKLLHILAAIIGVGFTSTFGIIMANAANSDGATPFALQTVSTLARIATWAFTVAIVTGLAMGHLGNIAPATLWFAASLVISIVAMGIAGGVAQPALRKQIALASQGEAALPELRRLGLRSARVGMFLSLLSLTLIALMIFKPTL